MAFKRLSMSVWIAVLGGLVGTSACSATCDLACAPYPCGGVVQPPPFEDPGTPPDEPRPTQPGTGEGWTWLLYIDADTFGGENIVQVLRGFAAAKAAPGARVFALVDQLPPRQSVSEAGPAAVLNLPAWSDVLLLEVHEGRLEVLETWDDAGHPMSEEATLAQFLATVAPSIGTHRVALWLYGHGQGWGGLCEDDVRGGDRLTYSEVAGAIGSFAREARPAVDLLILNTCYGSCLDAACALSSSAQFILASEMRTTDVALLGQGAIEATRAEPGLIPKSLGIWLTERYRGWEQPPSCGADRTKQGAVMIDSAEVATLAESLRDLLSDVIPHLSDPLDRVRLGTVAARTQAWLRAPIACCELDGCVSDPDDPRSCSYSDVSGCCMLDLKHFLEALAGQVAETDPRMPKIEATLIALDRCIACRATDAYQRDFGGLSVFLPCARTEFDVYMLGESCPPAWAEFVDAFLKHGCEAEEPALPQFMGGPITDFSSGTETPTLVARMGKVSKETPIAARWLSIRTRADQAVLLDLPLPMTGDAPDGSFAARWPARRVATLGSGPTALILPLRLTRRLSSGLLYCDQVPLTLRMHEGPAAPAIPVLAAVELPDPDGALDEGRLVDVRTYGERGPRVVELRAGQVLEQGAQRLVLGARAPRLTWAPLPKTLDCDVGFRLLGIYGGLRSNYVPWNVEQPR